MWHDWLVKTKEHFSAYPRKANKTYIEHLLDELKKTGYLFIAAICNAVHAFFPFLLEGEAAKWLDKHAQMIIEQTKTSAD